MLNDFSRDHGMVELQQAAADGDEVAWLMLVERFSPLVWSVGRAHGLSIADAQDVYQFVWLSLAQQLGHITEPARLGEWLYVHARDESLRFLGRARSQVPPANELDSTPYPDAQVLIAKYNTALCGAVDQLSPT